MSARSTDPRGNFVHWQRISFVYGHVYDKCLPIVADSEDRQVREGKRMTVVGPQADRQAVLVEVLGKLGFNPDLSERGPRDRFLLGRSRGCDVERGAGIDRRSDEW